MVDAHFHPRLQAKSVGLHAGWRAARRHVLRQSQRPAHQPRDSFRSRRPRRAVARRRRHRYRVDQQPGRRDGILFGGAGRGVRRACGADVRLRFSSAHLRQSRQRRTGQRHSRLPRRRRCVDRKMEGRRRPGTAHGQFQAGATHRRRQVDGVLQLLRPRRDSIIRICRTRSSLAAAGIGTTGIRIGLRR